MKTINPLVILAFFAFFSDVFSPIYAQDEAETDPSAFAQSLDRERPAWLYKELEACPADHPGFKTVNKGYSEGFCIDNEDKCLKDCKQSDAIACYSLALGIQRRDEQMSDLYEALFARACRLGHASGCTNRGAGLSHRDPSDPDAAVCYIALYKAACLSDDPWGCTMLGLKLFEGEHIEQDYDEAIKVMSKSCKFGEDDPACSAALALEKTIHEERNAAEE